MIDLRNESTVSLSQAGRLLPPGRRGRPVTLSCLLRWVQDGVKLPSGETVRLEACRMGGRWITSFEALQRFAVRQTPIILSADSPPTEEKRATEPRTAIRRRRESDRASSELGKIGM